jgi:CBS domain-containing protein/SAM-dependent methyltransferase
MPLKDRRAGRDPAKVTVREAMSPATAVFDEGHPLADALREMEDLTVRAMPVVAGDGTLKGLLVRDDGIEALRENTSGAMTAGDACRNGVSVSIDEPIEAALRLIQAEQVAGIPVVDGRALVGWIHRHKIRYFHDKRRAGGQPQPLSQIRWRQARPNKGLTWGVEISGDAFVAKAEFYGAFGPHKTILEIGPGYGRLLRAVIERELPFREFVAVDISPANVRHLTEEFNRSDVNVINADIETVSLEQRFDAVLSSLTLKHLYPSFEAALRNVERHLNPGATVIFDLIEGELAGFAPDGVTYLRCYSRTDVEALLSQVGLALVAFDHVEHSPGQVRLLVVARKADRAG